MFISNNIGIIADDLTGADDTSLQFFLRGANTQILLDTSVIPENKVHTQVWAIPTETRNSESSTAYEKVKQASKILSEDLNVEYFYKKMDSTIRGNIAVETLSMLEALSFDAAIIIPAFPQEGRTTIGGYHLLKGIPIERTEFARDPRAPIFESHIPTVLRTELKNQQDDLVDLIELRTVIKGAGPILMKINELVAKGVKLIVVDAMSVTDIEQVALAIEKSPHKILPCGSAGCAQVLANVWLPSQESHKVEKTIPALPKLLVSGSATECTAAQIRKLQDDDDIENSYFIDLKMEDILEGVTDDIVKRVFEHLIKDNVVVVHTSNLTVDSKIISQILFENEMSKQQFIAKIGDYLATLTQKVLMNRDAILITVGGETSFKCCKAINSNSLQIVDAICPAIPLCIDTKAQWVVTKSGNLGNSNTLIDIIKYFGHHE